MVSTMSNEKKVQLVAVVCFLILMAFFAGHRLGKSNADKWWQQYADNLKNAIVTYLQYTDNVNPFEKFVKQLEDEQKPRLLPAAHDAFGTQPFIITIPIRNNCAVGKTDFVCYVVSDSRLDAVTSLSSTVWTKSEWSDRR